MDAERQHLIDAVRAAAAHGRTLRLRGGGTKDFWGAPLQGEVLDTRPYAGIISYEPSELVVTARGGTPLAELEAALAEKGQCLAFEPPHFGAGATVGGMVAAGLSGPARASVGAVRDFVLGARMINGKGEDLTFGGQVMKNVAGYDVSRLLAGSWGTLGIVTEVTLRLQGIPEAISAAVCAFPDVDGAVRTVIETIQLGVPVARCEFVDEVMVRAINAHSKTALREAPTLFFEFHGSDASAREQASIVQEVARSHGGQDFEWATQPEDRTRLWNARHNAYFAALQLRPGCRAVTTDTCVPISRLAESIGGARRILDRAPCPTAIVGHVGDGNFHAILLIDPADPAEVELAERLNDEIVRLAIAMGGTCTGEHGIGLHKIGYLVEEAGEDAIDLMRRIKRALDPDGIMNPGKIFRG